MASDHGARVVVEDLASFSAIGKKPRVLGRRRGGWNKLLTRKQFEKLLFVLGYKMKAVGLPDPKKVRPAGTSQTCPECGHRSDENRKKIATPDGFEMGEFKCVGVECGYTADADLNAARIIAMKHIWLSSLPKDRVCDKEGKLPEKLRFEAFIKAAGERRRGALSKG
jgi:transposase